MLRLSSLPWHSEGGYIAAKVAGQDRSIAGVVSLAGPAFAMDRILLDQMDALNILAGKSESERATLSKANLEIYRLMQDKRLSLDEVKARAAKVMDPKQVLPTNAAELLRLQPKAQVQVFPKLNHLFLPSSTGSPMEYPTLKGHFSDDALDFLVRSLTALK